MCKQTNGKNSVGETEETRMREHFQDVVNGKSNPYDDFERNLAEATKIRNKVAEGKSENPSSDLQEAQRYLEEARNNMSTLSLKDVYCDILDDLQNEINQMCKP